MHAIDPRDAIALLTPFPPLLLIRVISLVLMYFARYLLVLRLGARVDVILLVAINSPMYLDV